MLYEYFYMKELQFKRLAVAIALKFLASLMYSYQRISPLATDAASLMLKAFNEHADVQDVSVIELAKGRKLN